MGASGNFFEPDPFKEVLGSILARKRPQTAKKHKTKIIIFPRGLTTATKSAWCRCVQRDTGFFEWLRVGPRGPRAQHRQGTVPGGRLVQFCERAPNGKGADTETP